MTYLKGIALSFAVVFGSEVLFRWIGHIYQKLRHYMMEKTYTKVVFFPDKGILSNLSAISNPQEEVSSLCDYELENYTFQYPRSMNSKCTVLDFQTNPFRVPEPELVAVKNDPVDIKANPFGYPQTELVAVKNDPVDINVNPFGYPEPKPTACKSQEVQSNPCGFPELKPAAVKGKCHQLLQANPFGFPEPELVPVKATPLDLMATSFGFQQNGSVQWNHGNSPRKFQNYLANSSSLIHIINVIDNAKRSLKICSYIFTCKELIEAVVRAKVSYYNCELSLFR